MFRSCNGRRVCGALSCARCFRDIQDTIQSLHETTTTAAVGVVRRRKLKAKRDHIAETVFLGEEYPNLIPVIETQLSILYLRLKDRAGILQKDYFPQRRFRFTDSLRRESNLILLRIFVRDTGANSPRGKNFHSERKRTHARTRACVCRLSLLGQLCTNVTACTCVRARRSIHSGRLNVTSNGIIEQGTCEERRGKETNKVRRTTRPFRHYPRH